MSHVCPWWGGYFIDNRFRRWLHRPEAILAPYVQPGMTVMDFGCGMGMFTIAMAHLVGHAGQVISVDLQQEMLDVLAKRARRAGVVDRIRLHRCEADSMGTNDPVDFVLAFYVVHEVPDPERLLAEVHQCLRPGGQFLLVEPIGHVSAAAFDREVAIGGEAGFTVVDRPRIRLSRAALLVKSPEESS